MVCCAANAQTLTEKLILTDTADSLYLKSELPSFDEDGNYCFAIRKNGQNLFITNSQTIGNLNCITTDANNYGNGMIAYTAAKDDEKAGPFYYKNGRGTKIYAQAQGKVILYETSHTRENMALVTADRNSIYHYANGKLLWSERNVGQEPEAEWIAFSNNGNTMYCRRAGGHSRLWVNGKLIDSCKTAFSHLQINDNGFYTYAKEEMPKEVNGDKKYRICTPDTSFDFEGEIGDYDLRGNNAYYYTGDEKSHRNIVIDNHLYKETSLINNIMLADPKHFLFGTDSKKIYANGTTFLSDCDMICNPALDNSGHYAMYGRRGYFIYKCVDGKRQPKSLTRYKSRAMPICISSRGESIHYFETDDSIYLFRDNKMLLKPISVDSNFFVSESMLPELCEQNSEYSDAGNLTYLEYGSKGYFLFNGNLSKAFPAAVARTRTDDRSDKRPSNTVAGKYTGNDFFAIQKTGNKKYLLIVNNKIYKELNGMDRIMPDYFFDGKHLTFYGIKGLSFYQYKMSL